MRKFIEKIKSIDKWAILRISSLIMAIVNQVIAVIGATSFANATWYQVVSVVATIITAVISAWYNNDFTFFARLGTKVLDALQDGKITSDEVIDLLKENEKNNQQK